MISSLVIALGTSLWSVVNRVGSSLVFSAVISRQILFYFSMRETFDVDFLSTFVLSSFVRKVSHHTV